MRSFGNDTFLFFFEKGEYLGYKFEGHSILLIKNSEKNTNNVVCAAVSSVAQSTTIGLLSVLGLKGQLNADSGLLELKLEKNDLYYKKYNNIKVLVDTLILMLKEIKSKYPDDLEIKFLEVRNGS